MFVLMKTKPSSLCAAALGLIALFAMQGAQAANTQLYWDPNGITPGVGGNGTWDTTTLNWSTSSSGNVTTGNYTSSNPSTTTANLTGTAGTVTVLAGTAIQVNNLAIGTAGYTVAGGAGATINLTAGTGADFTPGQISGPNSGSATVSAVVTGVSGMQKGGSGTLVLSGANTYTGNTTIRGGILSVATIGTTGSASSNLGAGTSTINFGIGGGTAATLLYTGTGEITDRVVNVNMSALSTLTIQNDGSGALAFTSNLTNLVDRTATLVLSGGNGGVFSGNVVNGATAATSFTKNGTGTWTLSGTNTYTGNTTVSAGTLLINGNGSGATGAVAVNVGTLGGNGTIGGDVTIANATTAILAPGTVADSTETLTLNNKNLTFSGASSQLHLDITGTAAGTFDKIVGINTLADNGAITFALSGTYGTASWDVLDFASKSGNFASVTLAGTYSGTLSTLTGDTWTGTVGGQDWTFEQTTGLLSVVPEPATWALLAFSLTAVMIFRRRKLS